MGLGPFERSRELITRYDLLLRFALFPLTIEKEREEERRERRGRIAGAEIYRGVRTPFLFCFHLFPSAPFFFFFFISLPRPFRFLFSFFRPLSNFAFLSFALCLRLPLCFVFLGRSFYIFPFRFSSQLLFIYTSSNCRFGLYIV